MVPTLFHVLARQSMLCSIEKSSLDGFAEGMLMRPDCREGIVGKASSRIEVMRVMMKLRIIWKLP